MAAKNLYGASAYQAVQPRPFSLRAWEHAALHLPCVHDLLCNAAGVPSHWRGIRKGGVPLNKAGRDVLHRAGQQLAQEVLARDIAPVAVLWSSVAWAWVVG